MKHSIKMKFGQYDYAAFSGYAAYACCAMVLSIVLAPLAESLGFPLDRGNRGAGGALHFWRSISMFCTMACCTFIAGKFGKRHSIGTALLVIGLGICCAGFAGNYMWLTGAVILSALGQGVFEVLVTPTVQTLHEKEDPSRYINVTHAFWSIGVVSIVILSGWALGAGVSWRVILFFTGIAALIPGILFLAPSKKQHFPPSEHRSPAVIWSQMKQVLRIRRFWIFLACMFLAGGAEHCLSFWLPSFIRMEYQSGSLLCGLGTAFFAVGMVAGRLLSGIFGSEKRMYRIILISASVSVLLGFLPPLLHTHFFLYLILFCLGCSSGPLWPSIQNYCVEEIREDPTTMFILLPCIGIPGCGFFTWLMGFLGDYIGLHGSFLLVPGCYLLLWTLIFLEKKHSRKIH